MAAHELTRRTLIGAGTAVAATLALGPSGALAADPVATFALDPTQGGACTGSCLSCQACQLHAANKLFETAQAADLNRAHPGCACTVIAGQALSQATWTNVFAQGSVADRRFTQTAQFLTAEVEQQSVPLVSGVVPTAVLIGGGAAIWLMAARRRPAPEQH